MHLPAVHCPAFNLTVITAPSGFNYTGTREVSPSRLLYIHDAPKRLSIFGHGADRLINDPDSS